jgi:hypothetical protein
MDMKKIFIAILFLIGMWSCHKDEFNQDSYLVKWTGSYSGSSLEWSSYPDENFQFQYSEEVQNVSISVKEASRDSIINIQIYFGSGDEQLIDSLKINPDGSHFSDWGGGSGYGFYQLQFTEDSLKIEYFQKCGIPCSSGLIIDAAKN